MSVVTERLSQQEQARYLETARLAGLWYVHNQNAPGQAWGGVDESADEGRFLYEYFPATGKCRGAGVWSQALGVVSLLALARAKGVAQASMFERAAELGAGYLCSLQMFDDRYPKSYGAFREHTPQTLWGSCRDGATGCFGLAILGKLTGRQEYLDRADAFCRWYNTHGSDEGKWPYRFYYHDKAASHQDVKGDWQAGGALCYYYTACARGEDRWVREGVRPVAEQSLQLADPATVDGTSSGWHGESRITVGNDDFATIFHLAAFLSLQDERYFELARRRVAWMLSTQAASGAFPNFGGTFVTALTLLDFLEVAECKGLAVDCEPLIESLLKAARFGLTLQETAPRDRRSYGGLYGQSNYAVSRDRIHNRDAAYSMHLYLRLAGCAAPCLSAVDGWL